MTHNGLWELYAVTQDGQIIPLRLLWKSAKRIYNDLTDTNAYMYIVSTKDMIDMYMRARYIRSETPQLQVCRLRRGAEGNGQPAVFQVYTHPHNSVQFSALFPPFTPT